MHTRSTLVSCATIMKCANQSDVLLQLHQKQIVPPYQPQLESELDCDNFDPQFTLEPVELTPDDA